MLAFQPDTSRLSDIERRGALRWQPDDRSAPQWSGAVTSTDRLGRFQVMAIPDLPGAVRVFVGSPGYHSEDREVPVEGRWVTRMTRDAGSGMVPVVIRGRVSDTTGAAVSGAIVSFGADEATADDRGCYEMHVSCGSGGGFHLLARSERGFGGLLDFNERLRACERNAEVRADLIVEDHRLAVAGRVLDEESRARPGITVFLSDPEGLLCLAPIKPQTTDGEGRFRFERLAPGRARIQVEDPGPAAATAWAGPVVAGDGDVIVRLGVPRVVQDLTVRVIGPGATPVAGATVRLTVPGMNRGRRLGRTAADGTLKVEAVPCGACLDVLDDSPDVTFVARRLRLADVASGATITADVSAPRRVVVAATDRRRAAARLRVLDGGGSPLLFVTHRWGMACVADHMTLLEGERPLTLDVGDDAHALRLEDGTGRVLSRRPLASFAGVSLEIEP